VKPVELELLEPAPHSVVMGGVGCVRSVLRLQVAGSLDEIEKRSSKAKAELEQYSPCGFDFPQKWGGRRVEYERLPNRTRTAKIPVRSRYSMDSPSSRKLSVSRENVRYTRPFNRSPFSPGSKRRTERRDHYSLTFDSFFLCQPLLFSISSAPPSQLHSP
jgi:hypothetical protein